MLNWHLNLSEWRGLISVCLLTGFWFFVGVRFCILLLMPFKFLILTLMRFIAYRLGFVQVERFMVQRIAKLF